MSRLRRTLGQLLALATLTVVLPHCTRDVTLDAPPLQSGPDAGTGVFAPADDAGPSSSHSDGGGLDNVPMCASSTCAEPYATCSTSKYLCDIDLDTDSNNCGSCGNKCPNDQWRVTNLRASWICVGGGCTMVCNPSSFYADCNGMIEDGCETSITGPENCGSCGNKCADDQICSGGKCVGCKANEVLCGTQCVDLMGNDSHCSACNNACSPFPAGFPSDGANAYWGCKEGECNNRKCRQPWADCNNDTVDGCEITLERDRLNCGQCGKACAPGEMCANGICQCNPGPSGCDCNDDFEADLMNCGACGNRCLDRTNAPATCKFGRCGNVCNAGFGDCNTDMFDGCEIDLMRDPQNCGTCGNRCATGQACIDGKCAVEPCPDGVIQ